MSARPLLSLRLTLALALAFAGGIALAKEEAKDPVVHARIALMQSLKGDMGSLSDMAEGKAPFDAAQAEAAIAALRDSADKVETAFRAHADDPVSNALPDIWNSPSEFRQKTNRLLKATSDLDAGDLADTLPALGAACKDCHGRFKM